MRAPFGDQAGSESFADPDVSWAVAAPSRPVTKMSPPREKAILPLLPAKAAWAGPGAAARAMSRPAARGRRRERIMMAAIDRVGGSLKKEGPDVAVRPLLQQCYRCFS